MIGTAKSEAIYDMGVKMIVTTVKPTTTALIMADEFAIWRFACFDFKSSMSVIDLSTLCASSSIFSQSFLVSIRILFLAHVTTNSANLSGSL